MESWVFDVLGCAAPGCTGKLRPIEGEGPLTDGVIRCRKCKTDYPVLGGVPILVPGPDTFIASYRDAVVASLAEARLLSRSGQRLIEAFAKRSPRTEPQRFGDDWVPGEGEGKERTVHAHPGLSSEAFDAFLESASSPTFPERLLEMLGGRSLGTVLELGPGAGSLSRHLRHHSKRLIVADLSLRATLRALSACREGEGAPVEGAVVDAEQLPLRHGAARTIVAANLIDLLDHPAAFLSGVADGLPGNGRLVLSTPSPGFGFPEGDSQILDGLVERSGLVVREAKDGLPWIRAHGPRHFEVYFVRALVAEHA
jgi:SAM-dependent methyltransferase